MKIFTLYMALSKIQIKSAIPAKYIEKKQKEYN